MISSRSFIIIKGQPKALQIDKMNLRENWVYGVKFKNSPRTFHYRCTDVIVLKEYVWHDHLNCKVFIGGREQKNVVDIKSFPSGSISHWRISFDNGFVQDYLHGGIQVVESCLSDEVARNSFEYLKRVAMVNELGKDEEHGGILPSLYEKIDFIDDSLAIAPYLNPEKNKIAKRQCGELIFPFGCNSSQEKAVTAAFENQISVVQGPPGTGKTQTILNVLANILVQGKTVMVVSNNNSATANVLEKLQKYGLGFIVATLGKRENKELFIKNQPRIPSEVQSWFAPELTVRQNRLDASSLLSHLRSVFSLQAELAKKKMELKEIETEWLHFQNDNDLTENNPKSRRTLKARQIMKMWLNFQDYVEGNTTVGKGGFAKFIEKIRWMLIGMSSKRLYGIRISSSKKNVQQIILQLQALYYTTSIKELRHDITDIERKLGRVDAKAMIEKLTTTSMLVLKSALYGRYKDNPRRLFNDVTDLWKFGNEVCLQYPVVLSTTFSARTAVPDHIYDYIIMDEASQVSVETGALALTCAKNAVIVGDTLQLPNVVTDDDRKKLDAIFNEYIVAKGYDGSKFSFLSSVCTLLPNVSQVLLREHYRCHPKIINFCSQRFYGGNLLIMTEDHDEKDVMMAFRTVPGHHARGHYNQREIDVVKQEVLPIFGEGSDVGIITPYNHQVDEFNRQIPFVEAATIHKYQGREKDNIIMSVVDDQITEFSDDPNLINVAISRAKKRFCLVVSGNDQERTGYVSDLIKYIEYQNFTVVDSKISSVFDYLFCKYTVERISFLKGHKRISEYDSENLTYSLLENVISEFPQFSHLSIFCHIPLRNVIRDWSLLDEEEQRYISHYSTHLDFLIINHVTKQPLMAIEVDGFSFHNDETEQHNRDMLKNHILETYELPLLRLSTIGSGEKDKIMEMLNRIVKM